MGSLAHTLDVLQSERPTFGMYVMAPIKALKVPNGVDAVYVNVRLLAYHGAHLITGYLH